jgi:hypothetical protein
MNRLRLLFTFLLLAKTLISQNKEIPFEISFNQSPRYDDRFLIELKGNNKEIVFEKDTKELTMPFFNETFYVFENGQYCLHTSMTTDDFKDSLSKKYCFEVNGNEEKIALKIIIDWDTLSRKPLNVYRSNKITLNKTVNDNPAKLVLKRLWKTPSPDNIRLFLPYEIYNPSDKLLCSDEKYGVLFFLEEFKYNKWAYLNCGSTMRLGKPFKPQQRFTMNKDGFVNGCDLAYLKNDKNYLRLRVEYHFPNNNNVERDKIIDKKVVYIFKKLETYQFFDEFKIFK